MPFDTKLQQFQEAFNESIFMVSCYCLFIFSDWCLDIDYKIIWGWIMIGIVGFAVLVNMCILFYVMKIEIMKALVPCRIKTFKKECNAQKKLVNPRMAVAIKDKLRFAREKRGDMNNFSYDRRRSLRTFHLTLVRIQDLQQDND